MQSFEDDVKSIIYFIHPVDTIQGSTIYFPVEVATGLNSRPEPDILRPGPPEVLNPRPARSTQTHSLRLPKQHCKVFSSKYLWMMIANRKR